MSRQLFGTDGMRGVAGEFPLDPLTVNALGAALGDVAKRLAPEPEIVIGMDTRESGPWLAEQVAGGLAERGVRSRFAGVITTPGIAYLTRVRSFVAGVMISASHNPYQDNGIKLFGHSGYKLPDEQERLIEQEIFAYREAGLEPKPCPLEVDPELDQAYVSYLTSTFRGSLEGLRLVVDCGNGAASQLAPQLLKGLGAQVLSMHCSPDGRNINLGCGALHPESLCEKVMAEKTNLGVAFDGDADRAIFVSVSGKIVDGDAVLLLAARSLLAGGRLSGPEGKPTVVATVMSNLGLERALAAAAFACCARRWATSMSSRECCDLARAWVANNPVT